MNLDRRILKAIEGYSEPHPQDLLTIIAYVDSQEKLVLTHEELSGGLQRLIESGQIAEATPLKYFDSAGHSHSRTFSGVSLQDHEEACEAYRKWFSEAFRRVEEKASAGDDLTRQKIVIRWKIRSDEYASDARSDRDGHRGDRIGALPDAGAETRHLLQQRCPLPTAGSEITCGGVAACDAA